MALTNTHVDAIARQVYRQFPELKGARPAVQRQNPPPGAAGNNPAVTKKERCGLTFKGSGRTPDGRTLARIVRVVADERGRILKTSTSK